MDKATGLFAIVLVLFWGFTSSSAEIIYVNVNGPNDPGTGTFEDPFRRIQPGIDAAIDGDTVLIQRGVYTGAGNYDLDPNGKAITVSSTEPNNPNVVACTIIDPNRAGRGLYVHRGEDTNCVISGLTIRNAFVATGDNGAGIYSYDSSPTIRNCVIRDGLAESGSGGGICLDYGSAAIINCTITGNMAAGSYGYGGGISCRFASPTITGCVIKSNVSTFTGGGIDSGASEPNIFNCVIFDNSAAAGGGINFYYPGDAKVVNCTIVANSVDYFGGAVHSWADSNALISNSILWANSAADGNEFGLQQGGKISVAYCDVQDGQTDVYDPCGLITWVQENIDTDPCFALFDPNGDPNLWDFHLQSSDGRWNPVFYSAELNNDGIINLADFAGLAFVWMKTGVFDIDLNNNGVVDQKDLGIFAEYYLTNSIEEGWVEDSSTSPCIDAGDPNSEFSGEPWPNGKRINMGAFGGTAQASKSGNIADLNIDGRVNFVDLAEFGKLWGTIQKAIEDLNGDGIINISDLEIIATNWLWEKE